jgi:Protein of unknown function (DUF3095)
MNLILSFAWPDSSLSEVRPRRHGYSIDVALRALVPHFLRNVLMAWAEAAMKRGDYAVMPGVLGARTDLEGFSCRFSEMPATRGTIVCSWFCAAEAADIRFRQLIASRFALIETSPEATRRSLTAFLEYVGRLRVLNSRHTPTGTRAFRWSLIGWSWPSKTRSPSFCVSRSASGRSCSDLPQAGRRKYRFPQV